MPGTTPGGFQFSPCGFTYIPGSRRLQVKTTFRGIGRQLAMEQTGVIRGDVIRGRRNPIHYGLPKRLRAAREAAGIAPARLSLDAGLAKDTVFRIDAGRVPLLDTVERLAQVLKISPCILAYNVYAAPLEGGALACAAVGQRLLQARTARGFSRNALGKLSGLSHTALGNIEDKGHMPSVGTVEALAKALRCDPCWLAYGAGAEPDLTPGPVE